MSTAPQPAEPLPQPPVTPEAIRAALAIPEKAAQTADDQDLPAILSAIRAIVLEATAEAGFTRDAP